MPARALPPLLLSLALTLPPIASAQDADTANTDDSRIDTAEEEYRHFLQVGYQVAYVFPMNNFIRGENAAGEPITALQAGRVEFGWQTTGSKRWHQLWNYPAFGIGHTTVDYFNEDEVGKPSAVYGFIALPVKRWDRWTFTVSPGLGLSYGWKPFDIQTNPYNQSIGAFKAAFIDVNAHFTYRMDPHWDLILAMPAYHFSNGGTQKPNNGFNQVGPMLSMRYKFEKDPGKFKHWDDLPKHQSSDEIVVTGAWGLRNIELDPAWDPEDLKYYATASFDVLTLSATWLRQTSHMSRWGAGVDLVSDESRKVELKLDSGEAAEVEVGGFDQYRLGLYGAYEYVVRNFAIIGHIGYTVYQKEPTAYATRIPRLYQRVGARYTFSNDWLIGLSVRVSEFSTAQHLEWTVGHRFKL